MMVPHVEREIYSQGTAWRSALEAVSLKREALGSLLKANIGREVRFLGSGSSYYLGIAAAPFWGRAGWSTRVLPSGEQMLYSDAYATPQPPVAIGVSRSGSTTEILRAFERVKQAGASTIGISTRVGTPMDQMCDVMVHVTGAQEESTVQTRSFSAQLLAVQAIARTINHDDGLLDPLTKLAPGWIEAADGRMTELSGNFARIFVLGTGSRWGVAMEGALKLKETSLTEAEAFHTLEFRHGPKSMVDEETLVVGLISDTAREAEMAVLREMQALGGKVLAVGVNLESESGIDSLSFPAGAASLPEDHRSVLYLPPLQLLAYRRGVGKGLDPDRPRNLTFAVEL